MNEARVNAPGQSRGKDVRWSVVVTPVPATDGEVADYQTRHFARLAWRRARR